jgi:hypothetical protein
MRTDIKYAAYVRKHNVSFFSRSSRYGKVLKSDSQRRCRSRHFRQHVVGPLRPEEDLERRIAAVPGLFEFRRMLVNKFESWRKLGELTKEQYGKISWENHKQVIGAFKGLYKVT